ncbi:hypothetical protein [Luteimonas mephitis]|uniref:hypothetical protein n=1 Tax=Luteimonas mephitis TaxID=83615 RepID=UPI00040855EF|nr:hypothetical protein [Luteimonas mephitis]
MKTTKPIATLAACLLAAACVAETPQHEPRASTIEAPAPQRAGQPVDPLKTAGHIAAARVAAITGNQEGVRQNMEAMTEDVRRAMKLPDAGRPIDPESARAAIRTMPGVRSVAWLDRSNLLVRITGAELRTYGFIDQVCQRLEPLGDTLAVVVHLRNANPRTRDEADSLGRNCQLAPGDVALLQRERKVDSLDPALRARFRADTERGRASGSLPQATGNRAALDAIPEM